MMKTILAAAVLTVIGAPALAQDAPAAEKKCCCDKMGEKKMDHSQMDHGSNAPK
jgi:hypothetical protein